MDILSRPAEEFVNQSIVEEMWATKAMEHAEIYFNLICSVDPRTLRLCPYDDTVYTTFRQDFPNLKIGKISDDDLKSEESKVKWRIFIEKFNKMQNFSYGTLLRCDASKEFSSDNSILVVRIQFLAIEIARNREGYNDIIREKFKPEIKLRNET
ncbi:protein PBDC1 [Condylostylus longicornis]|uniref:protein PBDC1 n=1 Tax=Condylostylus longicornis TaxID=2530218 RepID=UPI00244E35E3|nr:protein PBDC1 [Condylostylus longicornis]